MKPISPLLDEMRQRMQIIISATDNIRTRLEQLGIQDKIIRESQASIDRAIPALDQAAKTLTTSGVYPSQIITKIEESLRNGYYPSPLEIEELIREFRKVEK